jgi:hypothetical protein
MSFSAHRIPEIHPEHVQEMRGQGYSIARQAIPPDLYLPVARASGRFNRKPLVLSNEPQRHSRIPIEAHIIALAVHEAFFQSGFTDWKPNHSVLLKHSQGIPHADLPIYKIGVALVYTSGSLDMQVADTQRGLDNPSTITDIEAGDVLFLSALMPGEEPSNDIPDGRTWHNAVGGERTMLHMGYVL